MAGEEEAYRGLKRDGREAGSWNWGGKKGGEIESGSSILSFVFDE